MTNNHDSMEATYADDGLPGEITGILPLATVDGGDYAFLLQVFQEVVDMGVSPVDPHRMFLAPAANTTFSMQ